MVIIYFGKNNEKIHRTKRKSRRIRPLNIFLIIFKLIYKKVLAIENIVKKLNVQYFFF